MPISPTNQTKNVISPTNSPKVGVYLWGDVVYTWGDAIATWGGNVTTYINQTKNSISPTNQVKS